MGTAETTAVAGVTVNVTAETPDIMENQKTSDGQYKSGVGTILTIKFSDSKGPMAGMPVKESNTPSGSRELIENPKAEPTNSKGEIKDIVMRAVVSDSKPVNITDKSSEDAPSHQELRDHVNETPYNSTSTQTLTFTTTDSKGKPCTCQATYDRTLSNTDSKGKLNTQNNSQGVNYQYRNTQAVWLCENGCCSARGDYLRDRQGFVDLMALKREFIHENIWCLSREQDHRHCFIASSALPNASSGPANPLTGRC